MERLQAFKFELMPSCEQARKMRQFAGACRFVYNQALDEQQKNREQGGKFIGKFAMQKRLTAWRNSVSTPWLANAPRHALMMAMHDLDRAFSNFFAGRAGLPRFKRKGVRDGFADHVGAINVLERGQRLLACGEPAQLGCSKKQEPTEAAQAIAA